MSKDNQKLENQNHLVYVGTYTEGDSEGIYICQLDLTTGELRPVNVARNVDNPSYLAIDAKRHRLYAVNELMEFGDRPGGGVSAFAIQPSSGELSLINQHDSYGGAPCYLAIDRTGRYLFAVNYMGGNIAVISIDEDGFLGEPAETMTHLGSSLHPKRQAGPHPHSIVLDAANNYAFVPDLGLDKVMQYRFDHENGRLYANQQPWTEVKAGSGPRHMIFHSNGTRAYVINELSSTITSYTYDPAAGTLEPDQTISTVPEGYSGTNIAADLHFTPNGEFLYGSNRGHDSIAIYAIDQETGWLTHIDYTSTQGKWPRGFAIDPSGTFLLAANQNSHNIVTFWIDKDQGRLYPTGYQAQIPDPVCLKFLLTKTKQAILS